MALPSPLQDTKIRSLSELGIRDFFRSYQPNAERVLFTNSASQSAQTPPARSTSRSRSFFVDQSMTNAPSQFQERLFHEWRRTVRHQVDQPAVPNPESYQLPVNGAVKLVFQLFDQWGLTEEHQAIALGLHNANQAESMRRGLYPISGPDQTERIKNLIRIAEAAYSAFGDNLVAAEWMNEARDSLGGQSPVQVLSIGTMESLIQVRRFAEHVAGRWR